MTYLTAIALTDVEYNGKNGRSSAKKDSVISDLTEEECEALEALKSVRRVTSSVTSQAMSNAPSAKNPSRYRQKKRGR